MVGGGAAAVVEIARATVVVVATPVAGGRTTRSVVDVVSVATCSPWSSPLASAAATTRRPAGMSTRFRLHHGRRALPVPARRAPEASSTGRPVPVGSGACRAMPSPPRAPRRSRAILDACSARTLSPSSSPSSSSASRRCDFSGGCCWGADERLDGGYGDGLSRFSASSRMSMRSSARRIASAARAGSSKSTTRWLVGFLNAPSAPAKRSESACFSP